MVECHQFVFRDIDTHGLCRNAVIADRHDRTARPGIDDIQIQ